MVLGCVLLVIAGCRSDPRDAAQGSDRDYVPAADTGLAVTPVKQESGPDVIRPSTDGIVRLLPAEIPALPSGIAEQLVEMGCTIPQTWSGWRETPNNFMSGDLSGSGSSDWVVLCSRDGASRIVVVWGGPSPCASEFAERSEAAFLVQMDGEPAFARAISPGGPEGQAVLDVFEGKGGVAHYCRAGVWTDSRASD
jgi:hypothetical protein